MINTTRIATNNLWLRGLRLPLNYFNGNFSVTRFMYRGERCRFLG